MATVYVSSTRRDLEEERQRVLEWLADHRHERRHSYEADSETVRESCLRDVVDCDAYVLILGHRYGFVPNDQNPSRLSITELEYDAAVAKEGMPVVVLRPTYIRVIAETDIGKPAYASVSAFHAKVSGRHRPAEFDDEAALIDALSLAFERVFARPQERADVQAILRELTRVASESAHKDVQIEALRRELAERSARAAELEVQLATTVARTIDAAESPNATPAQVEAAQALRAGDTGPATELLREDERVAAVQIERAANPEDATSARKEAAALARGRGALAFQADVKAALEAYQEAATYEPDDTWTWLFLGDTQRAIGDLGAALVAYQRAYEVASGLLSVKPEEDEAAYNLAATHDRLGLVHTAHGDLIAASEAFEASLAIATRLAERDPGNVEWQRYVAISHNKVGDVRLALGDLPAASQAFEASLAIRRHLVAHDPANTQWQRDLSVSYERLGTLRIAQSDLPAALQAFETSLEIDERLAGLDPANSERQRDLSVTYNKLGDISVAQADLPAARRRFEASLAIREGLASRDPANVQWQRDLSVSHERLGNLFSQSDLPAALQAFKTSLAIRERLAARDPANAEWQLDLITSYSFLARHEATRAEERRTFLERGLARLEALAATGHLPPNQDWRPWFNHQLGELDKTPESSAAKSAQKQ